MSDKTHCSKGYTELHNIKKNEYWLINNIPSPFLIQRAEITWFKSGPTLFSENLL